MSFWSAGHVKRHPYQLDSLGVPAGTQPAPSGVDVRQALTLRRRPSRAHRP
jgi:hypothetical protein